MSSVIRNEVFNSQSLIARGGMFVIGIAVLAIASMLASVIIAETARGDAAAINLAGSLRMQSYHLAATLLEPGHPRDASEIARDFEKRLDSDVLTKVVPDQPEHPVRSSYEGVRQHWFDHMAPAAATGSAQGYLDQVDAFVEQVDHMVQLLQQEAEAKIQRLRLIQGVALFLLIALLFFGMYKLTTDVVPPLRELLAAVDRARRGDLTVRTSYRGEDELGLLSRTFNLMAEDLSKLYAELEARVEEKTAQLQQSNQALRLLYQTARQLGEKPDDDDYRRILEQAEEVLGDGRLTLCLTNESTPQAYLRVLTDGEHAPSFCEAPSCAKCLRFGERSEAAPIEPGVHSIPIVDNGHQFGAMLYQYDKSRPPQAWQLELLSTIGGHVASALNMEHQHAQQRRLALMEERAVIARELHDSLAQALSFLKIQVSRLRNELGESSQTEPVQEIIDDLREGLNSAYRQLRELLNTFRLKVNEPGLEPALQRTVAEFRERAGIPINLRYGLSHLPLTPNEEIHVLHLVREALANVQHHAKARSASVDCQIEDDQVQIAISDDGVGLPDNWYKTDHYGMTIMRERAEGLGGYLDASRREQGGTEITLTFTPQHNRQRENS